VDLCYAKTVRNTLLQVAVVNVVTLLIVQLEVFLRACRTVYRALDRKIDQCVGRVDAADTRDQPREYNRWVNPE